MIEHMASFKNFTEKCPNCGGTVAFKTNYYWVCHLTDKPERIYVTTTISECMKCGAYADITMDPPLRNEY